MYHGGVVGRRPSLLHGLGSLHASKPQDCVGCWATAIWGTAVPDGLLVRRQQGAGGGGDARPQNSVKGQSPPGPRTSHGFFLGNAERDGLSLGLNRGNRAGGRKSGGGGQKVNGGRPESVGPASDERRQILTVEASS